MGNVGLPYVGAVLFLNGMMLLGKVDPKAAGVFNLFVGAMQVIFPTIVIATADGDPETILGASGVFLFGFTYLYVGINLLGGFDGTGLGYFSLFVALMALAYAAVSFRVFHDSPFGVIWLYWAFLWALFFVLLGLKKVELTAYTGWVAAIEGWVTGAIPAIAILAGYWVHPDTYAWILAIFGVVVFAVLWPLTRPGRALGRVSTPGARAAAETPPAPTTA